MRYLLFLALVIAAQTQAIENKKTFDPADPSIWHEQPQLRDVPEDE